MSIFNRFFGNRTPDDSKPSATLTANPDIKNRLSLQLLFPDTCVVDSAALTKSLRAYHRSMKDACCDLNPELARDGKVFGLIGWEKHVIQCVGFDIPMPSAAVEICIAPSHYPQELKERARAHRAHLLLYYSGYELSPHEQYVVLAAACGAFAQHGALVILNEAGHTSFPAHALARDPKGDIMELLRTLPLPILYCGFVKHNVEGVPGVWMRTYGAPELGLPDFAAHASGHDEGQRYFNIFDNTLSYLRESGATIEPGHTMQIGGDEFLRARKPTSDELFLQSDKPLLVIEIIRADQINR